jgi:hypothetical protein
VHDYFLSRDTYVPPAAQIWRTAHLFRLPDDDFHNKKTGVADARARPPARATSDTIVNSMHRSKLHP